MFDSVVAIDKLGLSPRQEQAALLVAEGKLTHYEIAKKVKIEYMTLRNLRGHTVFQERVRQLRESVLSISEKYWIAKKERRLIELQTSYKRLKRRLESLERLVRNRGLANRQNPAFLNPNDNLEDGFYCGKKRRLGKVDEPVWDWAVDVPLLKHMKEIESELREIMKYAAIEMGEWKEDRKDDNQSNQDSGPPAYIVVVRPPENENVPKQIEQVSNDSLGGVGPQ